MRVSYRMRFFSFFSEPEQALGSHLYLNFTRLVFVAVFNSVLCYESALTLKWVQYVTTGFLLPRWREPDWGHLFEEHASSGCVHKLALSTTTETCVAINNNLTGIVSRPAVDCCRWMIVMQSMEQRAGDVTVSICLAMAAGLRAIDVPASREEISVGRYRVSPLTEEGSLKRTAIVWMCEGRSIPAFLLLALQQSLRHLSHHEKLLSPFLHWYKDFHFTHQTQWYQNYPISPTSVLLILALISVPKFNFSLSTFCFKYPSLNLIFLCCSAPP